MDSIGSFARPAPNKAGQREVMEAAAAVFMASGFDAASMDDIADRLGATKGRIYHYYRRKIDILMDIHREYLEENLGPTRLIAISDDLPSVRLFHMARGHVLRIMQNLPFARVGLLNTTRMWPSAEHTPLFEVVARYRNEYEALFVGVLQEGIDAGQFEARSARLAAKPLLGALNWTVVWYSPKGDAPEDLATEIARLSIAGLLAGPVDRDLAGLAKTLPL